MTQRPPKGHEEQREPPCRPVFDEVADEEPGPGHQRDGARHASKVEHDDERQIRQRGDVAEDDPEQKEVGRRAGLSRVAVLPGPQPLPALAHLGEVGGRVVPQVEEADEDLPVALDGVRVDVGNGGQDRKGEPDDQRKPPLGQRGLHLPTAGGGGGAERCRRGRSPTEVLDGLHLDMLSRRTVHRARRISPCDTFDAPAMRSSNRMGTSTTGYPRRIVRCTISIWNEYPCETTSSSLMPDNRSRV